jgi:hypothetical protein
MSFWRKVFGGGSKQTPAAPVMPQPRPLAPKATASPTPGSAGSLELPPEFDGKTSYRDMFRTRTPEQLHSMCRALPVEQLNLSRPGISREMGRAITQVFAVSIYMATKEVPSEYGDILFSRLVAQIGKYKGADLHLELCDLVRDFAVQLGAGGRYREAVRVLNVLRGSLFWRAWPQADVCLFASLNNIAIETNSHSDFMAALTAAERVPASQLDEIGGAEAIRKLKQRMEAAVPGATSQPERAQPEGTADAMVGSKAELIQMIERSTEVEVGGLIETETKAAQSIASSNRFDLDVVKELVLESFFDKMPRDVRNRNAMRSVSMKVGAAMGGYSFATWLAQNVVVGRAPAQMMDEPHKYGSFGMWQDAKALCEKHGVKFG